MDVFSLELAIYFILPPLLLFILAHATADIFEFVAQTQIERDLKRDTCVTVMAILIATTIAATWMAYWISGRLSTSIIVALTTFFFAAGLSCSHLVMDDDPKGRRHRFGPIGLRKAFVLSTMLTGCAIAPLAAIAWFTLPVLIPKPASATRVDASMRGERLGELAPRAAGLALVEVVDLKEVDERGGCGLLYLDVQLRILRRSGVTKDSVQITLDSGSGPGPPGSESIVPRMPGPLTPSPLTPSPLEPDTFTKGERYWIAFSSRYLDWERWPQGVVRCWPEKGAPEVLEQAIRSDHYSRQPQYDPRSGFTHSFDCDEKEDHWKARLSRDGTTLWEVEIPGAKFTGTYDGEWRLYDRSDWPHGLELADPKRSRWFLLAETKLRLENKNPYQLSPGDYRLIYVLDADTGKIASIRVSPMRVSPMSTPAVIQYFDLDLDRVKREERFDLLQQFGIAVGASEERWYRQVVQVFDPTTGTLTDETVYRHSSTTMGSKFVPIDRQ